MIEHLSTLVDNFSGAPNQTRCFTHILNLVAKSVLRQFDVAKKSGPVDSEQLNDATKELALLTQELDLGPDGADNDENDDDNDEGDEENNDDDNDGGDGENGMTEEELVELQTSLVPIWLMLMKVS
jgi:cobalamin biosynthesis protein CobT